jgi:hypothetical protein
MASVVISGDTSGTATLQAQAIAGNTTLTLPTTSGNVVADTATQTLTNKTLTTPTIAAIRSASSNVLPILQDSNGSALQSLTANGYQYLPGGLIIQWALLTLTGNPTTWTFPIAFPNACVSVQGTPQTSGQRFITVSANTTTTATVYRFADSGAGDTGPTYMLAIGY